MRAVDLVLAGSGAVSGERVVQPGVRNRLVQQSQRRRRHNPACQESAAGNALARLRP